MKVHIRWQPPDDVQLIQEADVVIQDFESVIARIKDAQQRPEIVALYVIFAEQGISVAYEVIEDAS